MEGVPKYEAANDNIEDLANLKESASKKASSELAERGLVTNVESVTLEELEALMAGLPALIESLTYDEAGKVKNENRYIVRELSVLQNKAEKKLAYEQAPSPALSAA